MLKLVRSKHLKAVPMKLGFTSLFSSKCPKIDGSAEEFRRFLGIELLATQANSKSGENVSKIIESESLKSLKSLL